MRDGLGRIQSLMVLGGGSDIALATVDALVAEGTTRVLLADRKPERLEAQVERLGARGVAVFSSSSADLFRAIVGLGWHPLMRVKGGGKFRPDGWHKGYPLRGFAPGAGRRWAKHVGRNLPHAGYPQVVRAVAQCCGQQIQRLIEVTTEALHPDCRHAA